MALPLSAVTPPWDRTLHAWVQGARFDAANSLRKWCLIPKHAGDRSPTDDLVLIPTPCGPGAAESERGAGTAMGTKKKWHCKGRLVPLATTRLG